MVFPQNNFQFFSHVNFVVCNCYQFRLVKTFSFAKNLMHFHYSYFIIIFSRSSVSNLFNPFPNKPWFLYVCRTGLSKTLREKEKLLVTSNFSFSHSVFYQFRELSAIFIKFRIVVCRLFQFGRVKNLLSGNGLKRV